MAKKVYISAGHQDTDPGAVKYVTERDEVYKISNFVAEELKKIGIIAYRDKMSYGWRDTVNEANRLGVDLFIEFHENAGKGDGAEVIIHNVGNQYISDAFKKAFATIGQNWRRTIVEPSFWVLKYTNMPAAIVEVAFVDNWNDIKDFDEDSEKRRLAVAMAKAIADILGVKVVAPTPVVKPQTSKPTATKDTLYRVQVGAFKSKDNASKQLVKVKNAGFDTCIVQVDGLYKIQVGAYSKKANAESVLAKLKNAGFSAFITTKSGTPVATPQKPRVQINVDGEWGKDTTILTQKFFKCVADGIVSSQLSHCKKYLINAHPTSWEFKINAIGSPMIKKLQSFLGVIADGLAGYDTVVALQKFLKNKGLYSGAIDGILGKGTVMGWQKFLNSQF